MTANILETPASPEEVIEHIRRYEFGIGASLEGDGRIVVDNMIRRYRNLLATIAEDLNSKESHFILELVQNADDNHYAEDAKPSLSFTLQGNDLVVVNNEVGFTADNVKALCSAGESSKKNKTGYIGEKGIGFKSVFKVTDAPEIHSNGYHFQFNRSDPKDLLGYVVPHWLEPKSPFDAAATTVVLPARPGRAFTPEMLSDLNATLLLFLDKLRQLQVRSVGEVLRYSREDSGALTTLTTVRRSSSSNEAPARNVYLRTKTALDMSDIAEPKRESVSTSDLLLALPLSESGEAAPISDCPTYAFLPIREFGFTFCIQGDFVLISSREGIHEDLPWNIRLRDAIAPTFVAAIEQFKTRPALGKSYLRFLPAEGDVLDPFFKPVVTQIVEAIKEAECIPVQSGGWRKPAEVLLASPAIHGLFTSKDVITLFGADYPNPDFVSPPGVLQRLGCRSLLITDVVDVFGKHSKWLAAKDLEWKAQFYAYLARSPSRDSFIKSLQTLPCLPTADGKMVAPAESVVFYPLSATQQYGFEHELTILDGELYEKALEKSADVATLFNSLNVRFDNPLELVTSHILKRHTHEGIDAADLDALLGHVRYIRDKLDQYIALASATQSEAIAMQGLRDGLFLGTKRNEDGTWYFDRPNALYMSKEYRPDFNIEGLLGDTITLGNFVSEKYIAKLRNNVDKDEMLADLARWREFFVRIGVHDSPRVVKLGDGDIKCSDELTALLQSDDQSVRRATLECLDRKWFAYDSHCIYHVKTGRYSAAEHTTQFAKQLRATIAPTKRRTVVTLDQSYHDVGDVRDILGGNVTFVDAAIHDERFLKACGITYKVDAHGCLKRLRQIRAEGGITRDQIRAIYRRLEALWNVERHFIEQAFAAEPLILVRSGERTLWVQPDETCWRSTNLRFLDLRHPPLQSQYVDHSTFFTKLLSVPLELPLDKWVDGLQALPTIEANQDRSDVALAIYRRLSRDLGPLAAGLPQVTAPPWLERFQSEALFLDHRGVLVSSSTSLFANDSSDHAALFSDVPGVSLLAVPREHVSAVANLLGLVGVRNLSTSLKVDVPGDVKGVIDKDLTKKLRDMFSCIARVVYGQSHERFETAVKDNLFDDLRQLQVFDVSNLELEVSLGEVTRSVRGDVARRGNEVLLRTDAPSHVDYVAMEVRKLLRLPYALSDTISRLLISPTVDDAEAFLQVRNISTLPPEEAAALAGLSTGLNDAGQHYPDADDTPVQPANDSVNSSPYPAPSPVALGESLEEKPMPKHAEDSPRTSAPIPAAAINPAASSAPARGASHPASSPINGFNVDPITPTLEPSFGGLGSYQPQGIDSPSEDIPTSELPRRTPQTEILVPRGESFPNQRTGSGRHKRAGKSRPMRTKKGRLLSYAEPVETGPVRPRTDSEPDAELTAYKRAIEQAAVKFFLETAVGQWQALEEMPPLNPGFDVKAIAFDGAEEVIEVKGQGGAWSEEGVALTPTELAKAQSMRGRYWLCVVEYAIDENRRQLSLIRDPFGLTNQFRFDKGWKAVAATLTAKPQRPEPGMFVQVPKEGKGRILKVKGSGQFSKLHVEFEDGRQLFSKVFNPTTMTLSFD